MRKEPNHSHAQPQLPLYTREVWYASICLPTMSAPPLPPHTGCPTTTNNGPPPSPFPPAGAIRRSPYERRATRRRHCCSIAYLGVQALAPRQPQRAGAGALVHPLRELEGLIRHQNRPARRREPSHQQPGALVRDAVRQYETVWGQAAPRTTRCCPWGGKRALCCSHDRAEFSLGMYGKQTVPRVLQPRVFR